MSNQDLNYKAKKFYDMSLRHYLDSKLICSKLLLTKLGFSLVLIFNTVQSLAQQDKVNEKSQLQNEGVATMDIRLVDGNFHLEFLGLKDWDYDLERSEVNGKTQIELRVPSLKNNAELQFKKIPNNDVVESANLERTPGGSKDIITLILKSNLVESFDYLTEKPSRLIVDLYLTKKNKQKKDLKLTSPESKEAVIVTNKQNQQSLPKKNTNRNPATDEISAVVGNTDVSSNLIENSNERQVSLTSGMAGIFDGGDPNFERFSIRDHEIKEESIVRSKENLYIPFPMLVVEGTHFDDIKSKPPIYEIIPKKSNENKMARLVLTLFDKKRYAVALKTAQWFFEKYPKSEYEEIIRYVLGDIYFKMWEKDGHRINYEASMQAYREALSKFPNSLLSLRTQFFMGYAAYSNKDYFASLRTFQNVVNLSKSSILRDKAYLSVARSLMRLNQYEEALKTYETIEKESFAEINRVEATYLKGDIYFTKKEYKKASEAYREAMLKYPQFIGLYPSASYNLAESLFWQKLYKASLEAYREFLTKNPGNSHASYAMTRAGEAMEILGADKRRVMGAFLEAYFRYGGTEGATIARMRILSNRMKQMKKKEAEKAIDEIQEYAEKIPLPQIDLFATIMISEGLSQRSEFERSIDTLLNWYQNNSSTRNANLIKTRIIRHVNEKMADDVENGNFIGALKLHNQYGSLWLKGSGRIDTVYNLGRAFELAGSYKESDTLFRETANLLTLNKNSDDGIEHSVLEKLPSIDEVYLRIAKVKMEIGEVSKSYDYVKLIKNPEKLSEEHQIERMEIAIKLLKDKGDFESAKTYARDLVKNWKGQPVKVVGIRLKLAQMDIETKSYDKAEGLLEENLNDLEDSKKIPSEEHLKSQKMLSDVLLTLNNNDKNKILLNEMIDTYSDKSEVNAYRYRLGKILFDEGNIQGATEIWKALEQNNDKFWWGIAKNNLKEKEWRDTYQKYIQRIPAMATVEEKGK